MPNPYWFLSSFVNALAAARNSSHVQSSLGGVDAVLPGAVGAPVDAVVGDDPREREDLALHRHRLPGDRGDVLPVLPVTDAGREILHGAHPLELADPVVPDLAAVGWVVGGDGRDELLPRLRLRHELDLHLEVLLRLVETLCERLDERRALGLGDTELEPHRLRPPRPAGTDEGLLPPREVGGRDDAGRGHRLEELPTGGGPAVVHRVPPFERWRGCNTVARRVSRPVGSVLSAG